MTELSIRRLDVRHGLLKAVREVSLDVAKGEVLALVGANGAGKTTLLRCLAGAHLPVGGQVTFRGEDITAVPSFRRVAKGIALVPEGRRLFGQMTVEENLSLGRVPSRPGPWSVERVLEAFPNLRKRIRAKAGTLSGGEQQATAIGRALMSNPELLMLDEVSLGLSPHAVDLVYDSLCRLVETGTTILVVEQDIRRALSFAGRVICLLEGQIALEGQTVDTTFEDVTGAYFGLRHAGREAAAR